MLVKIRRTDVIPIRNAILAEQGGLCCLCGERIADLNGGAVLDHDHKTGVVRGVLCRNCNGMEGKVFNRARQAKRNGTERDWIASLLEYWDKHSTPQTSYIHHLHKTADEKKALKVKRAAKIKASSKAEKMKELFGG